MARRMLRRRGGRASDVDVDEIVAETFLLLVRDDRRLLRAYDEAWPLRTWLSVLVRTAVGRQARRKRPVPRADLAPVDRERDPEQGARAREMETAVRRALARLGDRDRLLLRLRVVARLDYVGIAEALGIEASSVGPLVTRAKARLRAFLAEDPGGPAA
jgi:RNA polymerase sigma-70 factor (ECF subfamily)